MKQTENQLLNLIGGLDDLFIEEAAAPLTPAEFTPTTRKSRLVRKLLLIAASVALMGCLALGTIGIWKTTQESASGNADACRGPLYSGQSMEEFISYWQNSHFLVIPTSKTDAYTLETIWEDENAYRFTFTSTDTGDSNDRHSIRVYVSKPGGATMEGVTGQFNLTVQNGRAYHARTNSWFIDCNGTLLTIDLPPLKNANRFSTVTDLFSFTVHTTDGKQNTILE